MKLTSQEIKFQELIQKSEIHLRREWNMLKATQKEFEQRIETEMKKILKEIKRNRKDIRKVKKSLSTTINYFDTQNIKIKKFIGYENPSLIQG